MNLPETRYLLDVNILIARVFEEHVHHQTVKKWFGTAGLEWALCPFTEAGFLRYASAPDRGGISIGEATAILERLAQHPGFRYYPMSQDWRSSTKTFFQRLQGHKQITDGWLLGLAVREQLVLTTFDRALLHMAGEHKNRVRILGGPQAAG